MLVTLPALFKCDKLTDDAEAVTGDERDGHLYRVSLFSGETTDFRWRDPRPPIDEDDNSTS